MDFLSNTCVGCYLFDYTGFIRFLKKIHKEPKLFPMAIFSFFMGYIFGIVVSLEQLMLGGPSLYIVYYMAGLLFDTFHAVGNFCFYLICAPILMKVLKRNQKE